MNYYVGQYFQDKRFKDVWVITTKLRLREYVKIQCIYPGITSAFSIGYSSTISYKVLDKMKILTTEEVNELKVGAL